MLKHSLSLITIILFLFGCNQNRKSVEEIKEVIADHVVIDTIEVQELTDQQYADNPDIGFKHSKYGQFSHKQLLLTRKTDGLFDFKFLGSNEASDDITFANIDLKNMIPTVPQQVIEGDDYMSLIAIINQEWNRHQVRFDAGMDYFTFKNEGTSFESQNVTRIDIARNCLNSGLWEIIAYAKDSNKVKTYYHGWFDFPQDIYKEEFELLNPTLSYDELHPSLVEWTDPEMKALNLDLLRTRGDKIETKVNNYNNQLYVETGARKSKKKNIIYPLNFSVIQDFLTDSTQYSTFSPPGCYRTDDPRKTTLGKMHELITTNVYSINSKIDTKHSSLKEIELIFKDKSGEDTTTLLLGGLDFDKFPTISDSINHKGYKYPMGISNHSFYETYKTVNENPVEENPYYGFLYNEKQEWIDSHYFGIDGPLFFWDNKQEGLLHLYILSFERHSYVGHYTLEIEKNRF